MPSPLKITSPPASSTRRDNGEQSTRSQEGRRSLALLRLWGTDTIDGVVVCRCRAVRRCPPFRVGKHLVSRLKPSVIRSEEELLAWIAAQNALATNGRMEDGGWLLNDSCPLHRHTTYAEDNHGDSLVKSKPCPFCGSAGDRRKTERDIWRVIKSACSQLPTITKLFPGVVDCGTIGRYTESER